MEGRGREGGSGLAGSSVVLHPVQQQLKLVFCSVPFPSSPRGAIPSGLVQAKLPRCFLPSSSSSTPLAKTTLLLSLQVTCSSSSDSLPSVSQPRGKNCRENGRRINHGESEKGGESSRRHNYGREEEERLVARVVGCPRPSFLLSCTTREGAGRRSGKELSDRDGREEANDEERKRERESRGGKRGEARQGASEVERKGGEV